MLNKLSSQDPKSKNADNEYIVFEIFFNGYPAFIIFLNLFN